MEYWVIAEKKRQNSC